MIKQRPDRYAGFAHLPTTAPDAAADELERCVRDLGFKGAMINGISADGRFLDDPVFEPLLARAEKLDVPIYIHPGLSAEGSARSLLRPPAARHRWLLALAGLGLASGGRDPHAAAGVFRHARPPSQAEDHHRPHGRRPAGDDGPLRCGGRAHPLDASVADRQPHDSGQVWITTSGFFSLAPFTAALMTFGADRIMFSVDYPFSRSTRTVAAFLDGPAGVARRPAQDRACECGSGVEAVGLVIPAATAVRRTASLRAPMARTRTSRCGLH